MVSFNGLYDINWTQEVDERFIRHLHYFATLNRRTLTVYDTKIFEQIRVWLNDYEKDYHYDLDDLQTQFELCADRYVTWKAIISRSDIQYDEATNTVQGSVETWESICQNHELGPVYAFHKREPMWDDLIDIFDKKKAAAAAKAYLSSPPIAPHLYTIDELLQDYNIKHARWEEHGPDSGKKKGIAGESIPTEQDGGRADTASTSNMGVKNPNFFTGTPEERFDHGEESKAKRSLDF